MTVVDMAPVRMAAPVESVMWMSPADGLWVAALGGEYLGMVEVVGERYVSTDERGENVGTFTDLMSAQVSLEPGSELNTQARENRIERAARNLTVIVIASSLAALGFLFAGVMQ